MTRRAQPLRNAGFTLLELLIAMALLALVSLMAVQVLSGGLFQRDILARIDNEHTALTQILSLLRQDLEAATPMRLAPGRAAVEATPQSFTLTRAGIVPVGGQTEDQFTRVTWSVDENGRLLRQTGAEGEAVEMLPAGAMGLSLRGFGGDLTDGATLPPGFELVLEHLAHGPLRVVVLR